MITTSTYKASSSEIWIGRTPSAIETEQYWYQKVECLDLLQTPELSQDIALLGYACDIGVLRNQGRAGSAQGPEACRKKLSRLAWHHDLSIADVGDIYCTNDSLELSQEALAHAVYRLLSNATFPILIGGGHDMAWGHFKGIHKSLLGQSRATKVGIINFDAHFDLRPVVDSANSGTPFNQILRTHSSDVDYMVVGIQRASNAPSLFELARQLEVAYITNDECLGSRIELIIDQLTEFISNKDHIYLSIDLDSISSAYAPGVSAPSPMGFAPSFLLRCLTHLLDSNKVISCDIAELNPAYDLDGITASLAASIVDHIVSVKTM